MKKKMERVSLLSLSLMLVSTFAVSPALPQMISFYQKQGYAVSQVELLVSLSSFAILGMLLLNPFISKFLSEKLTVILGLLFLSLGGALPVLVQTYSLVFASRLVLGVGIGLINARAISIISEHYRGKDRVQMLGLRGSAEVLGSALLTFLAGRLLRVSWSWAFLIYGLGLLILALYLIFSPKESTKRPNQTSRITFKSTGLSSDQLIYILGMALYAGFVILVNSANTLRIPLVVEKLHMGTTSQSSLILSLMMLMGILAGTLFSFLLERFKSYLMSVVLLALAVGMFLLWLADNLWLLSAGALLTGFVYSLGVTYVFQSISESIPSQQLTLATTLVLLGCNLGGACAAFVLQFLGLFSSDVRFAFLIFALLSFILAMILLVTKRKEA